MSETILAQQVPVPKVISPTTHGVIDYCHVAFFFTVGLLCRRRNKRAAMAAFATSGFVLGQSLLTDYRLGVRPVLPFETHGKMDQVFAATSWLVPLLFGFRGTGAARVFEVNSLAESSVAAMTDWSGRASNGSMRRGAANTRPHRRANSRRLFRNSGAQDRQRA